MKRLTEEETNESNESSDESNESIHHIKEINIERTNKHYTATIKINGVRKEFIIDTGSPITLMPMDKRIVKPTEIQKVTNRYQDVSKNEVKSGGKFRWMLSTKTNKKWKFL